MDSFWTLRAASQALALGTGREARVPAGEQNDALVARDGGQFLHFADGDAGRLFEEHVLARAQRRQRRLAADLGRRAQRHSVDRRALVQKLIDVVEDGQVALRRATVAGGRDQAKVRVPGEGGKVLVVGDLAQAHEADPDHAACLPFAAAGLWP